MEKSNWCLARKLAEATSASEKRRTGHAPKSVSVVLIDATLVLTLHTAVSPGELALPEPSAGTVAARVKEYHRQRSQNWVETLRLEIERIAGVAVPEATTQVDATSGTVVRVFATHSVDGVFILPATLSAENWSGVGTGCL